MDFQNYRLYSRGIKSGGAVLKSSGSGGGSVITSSSGGGSVLSASAGGGTTQSTSVKTFVQMNIMSGVPENSVGTENWGYHMHEVQIPGSTFEHDHSVTIPNHQHSVTVPNHQHSVTVPAHAHDIDIPAHSHDIEFGIFKLDRMPTAVQIKVDGNIVPYTDVKAEALDLIPYLDRDADGKVTRGKHTVSILPNDLARINAQVMTQFFMQSRGGGSY